MRKIKSSGRKNSARSRPCAATWDYFDVTSLVTPANSGTATKVLPSPKLSLIFGPWSNTEFYVQGGFGFHSNDGRGATQTVEPVSADNPYPNTPVSRIPVLIPTKGAEIGVRTRPSRICKAPFRSGISTALPNCSRMATPEARLLRNSRATAMASNGRTTTRHWNIWLLILTLRIPRAFFTAIDGDDAAPDSPGGKRVPEAVGLVISSGITLHDFKRLFGEFAPALLWPARFDIRRNLSLKCDGFAQCGGRLSN